MDVTLRPAAAGDYDFLFRLHIAAMRPWVEQTWGWNDAMQAQLFRDAFDPAGRRVIVIDGRDAGVLVVERRPEEWWLGLIELLPEYHGQGVGSRLITSLLTEAAGVPVSLRVLLVNPAQRLYERQGFRETGRTATHRTMQARPEAQSPAE